MPSPKNPARTIRRVCIATLAIAILSALGLAAYAYSRLAASLPQRDGAAILPALTAPAQVEFDDLAVPTIRAATLPDAIAVQGFLDAQERFFQMDLARRAAAGELAALVGPRALATDRRRRADRFRHVAQQTLANTPPRHRALLTAYTRGVNAGLAALGDVPPEYLALRREPEPWRPEDCFLVSASLALGLAQDAALERMVAVMDEALPPELVRFLTPATDRDDAPILYDDPADPTGGYRPAPIPGPGVIDLRDRAPADEPIEVEETIVADPDLAPFASNNWAVAGARTARGDAICANDPHLWHSVPNVWRRSRLIWPGGDAVGVNTPGFPGIVIGATRNVAWGFTNTTGDFQDHVLIELHPDDPNLYKIAPGEHEPFTIITETIEVAGAEPERLDIRITKWGAVIGEDHNGNPLALKWAALDPDLQNLEIFDLMSARSLDAAVEIMRRFRGPSQNAVMAGDDGRIAWVVTGYLPRREGFTGRVPVSWARDGVGWDGELPQRDRPVLIDPPSGVIVTANNRTADLARAQTYGRAWARPARAKRILERLAQSDTHTERGMLALQLDTQAPRHARLLDIALRAIDADGPGSITPEIAQAREILESWDGTAEADQPGYRILERFRRLLRREIVAPLVAPCLELDPAFTYRWTNTDEPVMRLIEERPAHLLPPRHDSWDALVRSVFAETVAQLIAEGGIERTWGDANRADIAHPFSRVAPFLSRFLDMPPSPLAGDAGIVRVATPRFGASLRLVASPSNLEEAIFHMPAGQSGHPLSRHYRAGHIDWVEANPTPLLPGETVSTLRLTPTKE